MLIDAFIVGPEYERPMIDFRLKMLDPYVDLFVIVECDHTFSGKKKGFVHDVSGAKISKVNFSLPEVPQWNEQPSSYDPSHPCWSIEYQHRNHIVSALNDYSDDDFVLMGDMDEIPSREALDMMVKNNFMGIATFSMFFFYYNLHTVREEMWSGTIWTPMKALRKFGAQALRDSRGNTGFNIERGGWHLSYMGGTDAIRKKIGSFSHQEYNIPEYTDEEKITRRVMEGSDLFGRDVKSALPPDGFFPDYFKELAPEEWL